MVILWLPFQGHESYLLSLLSENNKCDYISEYTPQTYGSPTEVTEWFNQDVGLDLRTKYFIESLDGDHKIIWSKVFESIWNVFAFSNTFAMYLRTHEPEHSIFVTDTFILITYALTWDSMMYHHCEKVPAALWVYHGVHWKWPINVHHQSYSHS